MFFTAGVSEEAAAHAAKNDAPVRYIRSLRGVGVSALIQTTQPEPVEADGARQVAVLIYTSGTTVAEGRHAHASEPTFFSKDFGDPPEAHGRKTWSMRPARSRMSLVISLLTMMLNDGWRVTRLASKYSPAGLAKATARGRHHICNGVRHLKPGWNTDRWRACR